MCPAYLNIQERFLINRCPLCFSLLFKKTMKYSGIFKSFDGKSYKVELVKNNTSTLEAEFILAADEPFVVNYSTSDNVFEPLRKSTATINIVRDDYMFDLLSAVADGVRVNLINTTDNTVEWTGYLNANLLTQDYSNCMAEFSLEASDCLTILQRKKYQTNTKQIKTFEALLTDICVVAGLKGYYWPRTKKNGAAVILPDHLKISEKNFYTNDTEDPWKYDEVLTELCTYLGLSAIQVGEYLYLLDVQHLRNNDDYYFSRYTILSSGHTEVHVGGLKQIAEQSYRGNNNTISYSAQYNKVTVRDNFYLVKDFVPDIFEEDKLTNRFGEKYVCQAVNYTDTSGLSAVPEYINNRGRIKEEKVSDADYAYYTRIFDNEHYESIYYDRYLNPVANPADKNTKYINKNYVGGTIADIANFKKTDPSSLNYQTPTLSFDRYLCICQKGYPTQAISPYAKNLIQGCTPEEINQFFKPVFKLKDYFTNPIIADSNVFLTISASALYERYPYRNWINPEWTAENSGGNSYFKVVPCLVFKLGLGNQWWNGTYWQATECAFPVKLSIPADEDEEEVDWKDGWWNKNQDVLNNVDWAQFAGVEGYKIQLPSNVDLNDIIHFEVRLPGKIVELGREDQNNYINNYVWIKDLKLQISTKLKDEFSSDVVYENIVDEENVNELEEITCRFTTYPSEGALSYSNVALNGSLQFTVKEDDLTDREPRLPEENLVERYYEYYSIPRIQKELELDNSFKVFDKIEDTYDNTTFIVTGTQIDYQRNKQQIRLAEI